MAYQIDFTASDYVIRTFRKWCLRLLLVAMLGGLAYGVYDCYRVYNESTLNMKLADYEAVTYPIEEMNAAWNTAEKEYNSLVRYYRLIWAENPTNVLGAVLSQESPRLGRKMRPRHWTLTTGGDCRLDYRFVFAAGDKAAQTTNIESMVVLSITSGVEVVGGKVDVQGVLHENLLNVEGLDVSARFALPNVKMFPSKEPTLASCVTEIGQLRKTVQDAKIVKSGDAKGAPSTAQAMMMAYLPNSFAKAKDTGELRKDFPVISNVVNVAGWLDRADRFIEKYKIPPDPQRKSMRESWQKVGEARYPWDRHRALDNEGLVQRTKNLMSVSDGVKRFKGFLDKRHADCLRKLEPFIDSYPHDDIFNQPLVKSDLVDRAAKAAGISHAEASFKDEPCDTPAVLVQKDETFTFTWVRWTLTVGTMSKREGAREQTDGASAQEEPLTLEKLADCVHRVLTLGPGYALDTLKIDFGEDGKVAGAVIEGLLPVHKRTAVEQAKK